MPSPALQQGARQVQWPGPQGACNYPLTEYGKCLLQLYLPMLCYKRKFVVSAGGCGDAQSR